VATYVVLEKLRIVVGLLRSQLGVRVVRPSIKARPGNFFCCTESGESSGGHDWGNHGRGSSKREDAGKKRDSADQWLERRPMGL
jgi:hypothetical protein